MKKRLIAVCIAASMAAGAPALAHEPNMPGMAMTAHDADNPYMSAEMDMHHGMMAVKTGDAAEMWTRKMIEHHRGAVAMSRIAIAKASDAETRQMARMNIAMQEKDIAKMQAWLKRHGKRAQ